MIIIIMMNHFCKAQFTESAQSTLQQQYSIHYKKKNYNIH